MNRLVAWYGTQHVGELSINDDGRWSFKYDDTWLQSGRFSVSPHLRVDKVQSSSDLAHQRTVEWFFDNLLPEGGVRESLAKRCGLNPRDAWGMLETYGRDTAGALSLLPVDRLPETEERFTAVTEVELMQMVLEAKAGIPLLGREGLPRMSLAGAQEKIALRINQDGSFWMPEGAAVSTHIVKPANTNSLYPFVPSNEWFCMEVARASGLTVPAVSLVTLPNQERLYCVERFDRRMTGGVERQYERIHQVDMCQACNVPPSKKYESDGGLDALALVDVVDNCEITSGASRTVMQWMAFNYLIGNDDAHAKNLSFFMKKTVMNPTPFYDLLCVEAYHDSQQLAMSIGGEIKAGFVTGTHWDALSLELGRDPRGTRQVIAALVDRVDKVMVGTVGKVGLRDDERQFIEDKVKPVIQMRIGYLREAMREPLYTAVTIQTRKDLIPNDILERIAGKNRGRGSRVE